MPVPNTNTATATGRLDALRARHESLKEQIKAETKYPSLDEHRIKSLKIEKLRIKEEKELLETASRH